MRRSWRGSTEGDSGGRGGSGGRDCPRSAWLPPLPLLPPDGMGSGVGLPCPPGVRIIRPPFGQVAQLVEQRTENPRVGSSILPLATATGADRRRRSN